MFEDILGEKETEDQYIKVIITDEAFVYGDYIELANKLKLSFWEPGLPDEDDICYIVNTTKHPKSGKGLFIIKRCYDKRFFIIGKEGIKAIK